MDATNKKKVLSSKNNNKKKTGGKGMFYFVMLRLKLILKCKVNLKNNRF